MQTHPLGASLCRVRARGSAWQRLGYGTARVINMASHPRRICRPHAIAEGNAKESVAGGTVCHALRIVHRRAARACMMRKNLFISVKKSKFNCK